MGSHYYMGTGLDPLGVITPTGEARRVSNGVKNIRSLMIMVGQKESSFYFPWIKILKLNNMITFRYYCIDDI